MAGVSNRNARGPPFLLSYIGQESVAAVAGVSNRNARGPHFLLSYIHRRSMETEAKANCRRFILGGKIECRTRNVWLECVALCT